MAAVLQQVSSTAQENTTLEEARQSPPQLYEENGDKSSGAPQRCGGQASGRLRPGRQRQETGRRLNKSGSGGSSSAPPFIRLHPSLSPHHTTLFSSPFHRSLIRAYWPRLPLECPREGRGAATPIACLRGAVVGGGTVGNYGAPNSCAQTLVNRARINKADLPPITTPLSAVFNSIIISLVIDISTGEKFCKINTSA